LFFLLLKNSGKYDIITVRIVILPNKALQDRLFKPENCGFLPTFTGGFSFGRSNKKKRITSKYRENQKNMG
jgi:hypothetical protein